MQTIQSVYSGPERRRRRVYVTQNREYHCKDGVCVAVRDARSREFVPRHLAVGKTMTGAFVLTTGGGIESISLPENAIPGQRAHFSTDAEDRNDVVTSSLRSIERPSREVVAEYEGDIR
jgi:hypothetical protein